MKLTGNDNEQLTALRIAVGGAHKPTIAVDFDGTISQEGENWNYPDMGEPFPGVREALSELKKWFVIRIYTCRMNGVNAQEWHANMSAIKEYMDTYGIPYDDIVQWNEGKPFADYYIDNRAVGFNGDWSATVDFIKMDSVKTACIARKILASKREKELVAGAIYDLLGYLTSLDDIVKLGATEDATKAIECLRNWVRMRKMAEDIFDSQNVKPDIKDWHNKVCAKDKRNMSTTVS